MLVITDTNSSGENMANVHNKNLKPKGGKSVDESYWHPDDKEWMKKRKEEWRVVKHSLDVISSSYTPLKRAFHKHHKELFFTGSVDPGLGVTGKKEFCASLPVFQVWYHPRPDRLDLNELLVNFNGPGRMTSLREHFFGDLFSAGGFSFRKKMFSPVTGMMNGREADAVRLVCPGLDYKQLAINGDNINFTLVDQHTACAAPYHLGTWLRSHSQLELMRDARFVPYAPGQYLWDHLSFTLEHYPNEHLASGHKNQRYIELIAEVLAFEKRTDKSRNRPSTIAFVERLINKYENKSFSDAMLALWEEAKKNIDKYLEASSHWVLHDAEELEKHDHMPVEVQQERASQWLQVS